MVAIPSPPLDNSGGYMVLKYTNGTDVHRMRVHVRPFGSDGTFTAPSASGNATVMAEFTAYANMLKAFFHTSWTFSLDAIYQRNADNTFTELFGWASPATVAGTNTNALASDQIRALMAQFNFRDGFGGRARIVLIGQTAITNVGQAAGIVGGNPAGDMFAKLVDYLSTATKTNIVSHNGHVLQNNPHITYAVNRRLRRHYGFA